METHGPEILGALAMLIRFPVEKRKYVPSVRRISAGSCELPHIPEQAPGKAYALLATTSERSEMSRENEHISAQVIWRVRMERKEPWETVGR
jgi:hypothetical protein